MPIRRSLFERLDHLEAELRDALIPALQTTAAGRDELLFCTRSTNPYPELRHHTSERGQELLDQAVMILKLAKKLGQSPESLLAAKVVVYFHMATDLTNHHRGAPAGLARQFLRELGEAP